MRRGRLRRGSSTGAETVSGRRAGHLSLPSTTRIANLVAWQWRARTRRGTRAVKRVRVCGSSHKICDCLHTAYPPTPQTARPPRFVRSVAGAGTTKLPVGTKVKSTEKIQSVIHPPTKKLPPKLQSRFASPPLFAQPRICSRSFISEFHRGLAHFSGHPSHSSIPRQPTPRSVFTFSSRRSFCPGRPPWTCVRARSPLARAPTRSRSTPWSSGARRDSELGGA